MAGEPTPSATASVLGARLFQGIEKRPGLLRKPGLDSIVRLGDQRRDRDRAADIPSGEAEEIAPRRTLGERADRVDLSLRGLRLLRERSRAGAPAPRGSSGSAGRFRDRTCISRATARPGVVMSTRSALRGKASRRGRRPPPETTRRGAARLKTVHRFVDVRPRNPRHPREIVSVRCRPCAQRPYACASYREKPSLMSS